jgi:prepilin-type N-terminal cleavage/methylation domain-containing protein
MNTRRAGGYTLIELMIVLVIVAVLAAIAIPNYLRSKMAANEAAAIASCKAYASAQNIYRRTDYNQDGVLEYAQHLSGNNSLYESVAGAGDIALIDQQFAHAEGNPMVVTSKSGYVFKVLTAQGPNAPGGAYGYLDGNGAMTLGFALSAIPDEYELVGRNSFMINTGGTVYQIDRGSAPSATHLANFDPDSTWVVTE